MKKVSQKEVLEFCIQNKISFAIYKLPGSSINNFIIAKAVEEINNVENFEGCNDGFVISPFSYRNGGGGGGGGCEAQLQELLVWAVLKVAGLGGKDSTGRDFLWPRTTETEAQRLPPPSPLPLLPFPP